MKNSSLITVCLFAPTHNAVGLHELFQNPSHLLLLPLASLLVTSSSQAIDSLHLFIILSLHVQKWYLRMLAAIFLCPEASKKSVRVIAEYNAKM
jgi:hypothetical protein